MKLLYSETITLFLVMDSLGVVPIALASLKKVNPKRHTFILFRESIIAFLILALFLFFGDYFLQSLNITQAALRIAGGIILFLIAIKMIFPREDEAKEHDYGEPFIVPLAIPMIAGPSAMATIMLFSTQHPEQTGALLFALFIASALSALVLIFGSQLRYFLGEKGLIALERLIGMLLTTIAVQMFLDGMQDYLHLHKLSGSS